MCVSGSESRNLAHVFSCISVRVTYTIFIMRNGLDRAEDDTHALQATRRGLQNMFVRNGARGHQVLKALCLFCWRTKFVACFMLCHCQTPLVPRPLWDGDTKTDFTNFCSVHYPSSHRCLGIYAWQWSLFILFITYYNVTLCLEFTQWKVRIATASLRHQERSPSA